MERDPSVSAEKSCSVYFNSHAHVERDGGSAPPQSFRPISTHTLTWSVTAPYHSNVYQIPDFNSHAHVERDMKLGSDGEHVIHFNSHAHVERDRYPSRDIYNRIHFNSHAHVERDTDAWEYGSAMQISTHTLTWSVTLDVVYIWCLLNVMRTYFFI